MRKTRTIAAVLMLATTFCADRAAVPASQGERMEPDQAIRGIAQRLTASFQRVVRAPRLHQSRQEGVALNHWLPQAAEPQSAGRVLQQTPFHFRLPPPVLA